MSPWGPGTAILFILALGVGLVLLVWAVYATFPRVTRVVTRSFWCPFRERNVTVEFQEEPWDGRHVEVNRCVFAAERRGVRERLLAAQEAPVEQRTRTGRVRPVAAFSPCQTPPWAARVLPGGVAPPQTTRRERANHRMFREFRSGIPIAYLSPGMSGRNGATDHAMQAGGLCA